MMIQTTRPRRSLIGEAVALVMVLLPLAALIAWRG